MTATNLFIIFLLIALGSGCIGYFIGVGVANARFERNYHLVKKEE